MDSINFDVDIGQPIGDVYPVTARCEPLGSASDRRAIDSKAKPLADLLTWAAGSVSMRGASVDQAEDLGAVLYEALFGGSLGEFLRAAQQEARTEDKALRLRLSSDDLGVMSLPWEFLFDRMANRLFATDPATPLVRYLSDYRSFDRPRNLAASLPLRILLVVPAVSQLDVAGEFDRVREALDRETLRGQVELVPLDGSSQPVTLQRLLDTLQEDQAGFDVLHFSGHGRVDGGRGQIRFNDERGGESWIDGGVLARSLARFSDRLRLAVLNSCEGGVSAPAAYGMRSLLGMAPALIQNGFAAVVAMQYKILDSAALVFARSFYRGLTIGAMAGWVDAAVSEARNRLAGEFQGHRSFATPVLFLHTPDGQIFDLAATESRPIPPEQAEEDEALLRDNATLSPRELQSQIAATQRLLEIARDNLAVLQEQSGAMGLMAPPYVRSQLAAEQAKIDQHNAALARLNQLQDLAQRLMIPDALAFGDFVDGRINESILRIFMAPLRGDFDDLDVVREMSQAAPAYRQRLARKLLSDANAGDAALAEALHRQIEGFVRRPRSGYIMAPGGKYRKTPSF